MPIVLFVVIVVALVVLGPLALIWSLNTLFGLTIAYTFKTWLAALIIGGAFGSSKGASE